MTDETTGFRLAALEARTKEFGDELRKLEDVTLALVRVQSRQESVTERLSELVQTMGDQSRRISDLERSQPGLLETRTWVVGGVAAALVSLGHWFIGDRIVAARHEARSPYDVTGKK